MEEQDMNGIGGIKVADKSENVFMIGTTTSTNNIASAGSFQDTLSGNYDFFIVKFNAEGDRLWGTYFGGPGFEYISYDPIAIDKSGNVYISGQTNSTTGIATPGAHQMVGAMGAGLMIVFLQNSIRWKPALGNLLWRITRR